MSTSMSSVVYAIFLGAMILFNMVGNSMVCIVVLKNKAMRTSINWLLFYLAIADVLFAVFFTPCILSHFIKLPSGIVGDMLCKFLMGGAFGWASASASSFLLVLIAFERYHATLHPLKMFSRGRSLRLVPVLWIVAILLAAPMVLLFIYQKEIQACEIVFPNYLTSRFYHLIWSCCNEFLPICIMGYLYTRIVLCLRERSLVSASSQTKVLHSRHKVTRMVILVSVIFVLCWTPSAVLCALTPLVPGHRVTVDKVAEASALLNSCLNPLLYTLHSEQFRRNLASLFSFSRRERKTK